MELPRGFARKEYIEIWYSDLAKICEKHFGGELDMAVVMDFPSQDTYRTVTVPSYRDWAIDWESGDYDNDSPELIAKIRQELTYGVSRNSEKTSVSIEAILDLLHEDGIIPTGNYLITVWW